MFSINKKRKKLYCSICSKYRKFEKPKILYFSTKIIAPTIMCSKFKIKEEKLFKEEESIEILKFPCLIENI